MKNRKITVIGCLLLVAWASFLTVQAWAGNWPERYRAEAVFSVNWNQMPSDGVLNNSRQFDKNLAKFHVSEQYISLLLQECATPSNQIAALRKELRRNMTVSPAGATDRGTLYRIQFMSGDEHVALAAVNLLCQRFVEGINGQVRLRNTAWAAKSWLDNATIREKESRLSEEESQLMEAQRFQYSAERATRIEAIRSESSREDGDKMTSGLELLVHAIQMFQNPAATEQEGTVQQL